MFTKFRMGLNQRFDKLVIDHLAERDWFHNRVYVWLFRLGHWAGFHHVAVYAPDDSDTVQGITFGTEQYVDEVVLAHEHVYGEPEQVEDGDG